MAHSKNRLDDQALDELQAMNRQVGAALVAIGAFLTGPKNIELAVSLAEEAWAITKQADKALDVVNRKLGDVDAQG